MRSEAENIGGLPVGGRFATIRIRTVGAGKIRCSTCIPIRTIAGTEAGADTPSGEQRHEH